MKNIFIIALLMICATSVKAQSLYERLKIKYQTASTPYAWRWGAYDSVLKVPYGPVSILREGGVDTLRPGALFWNTTYKRLDVWDGTQFVPSAGTVVATGGGTKSPAVKWD